MLLAVPAALHAQLADVTGGTFNLVFSDALQDQLQNQGITIEAHNYREWTKPSGFVVRSGTLDMSTGKGQINVHGGYRFIAGSTTLFLAEMQIDNSGPAPVITALPVVNNVLQSRIPVFTILGGVVFKHALVYGTNKSKIAYIAMDPGFWNTLLATFQLPPIVAAGIAGTESVDVTMAAPATN